MFDKKCQESIPRGKWPAQVWRSGCVRVSTVGWAMKGSLTECFRLRFILRFLVVVWGRNSDICSQISQKKNPNILAH